MTDLKTATRKPRPRWVQPRHTAVRNILYWPLYLYTVLRYRIRITRTANDEQCLVLFNHQTPFDQFFVSLTFPQHLYYVASEDVFSNGFVSRMIAWLVAPIPFRKSTADIAAVKNCLYIAREGGSIAMAPEGNRTYSGTTEHMKPSVVSLVRALRLPLALYRIEGGYGTQPRWSDAIRKGKMRAYISRVVRPEEYREMSDAELFALIEQELYVDERQDKTLFYSKRSAEFLDRAMYYCPECGLSEFYSCGDTITCKRCGRQIRYLPGKELEGVGFSFPYRYVKDWYDAQSDFVRSVDMARYLNTPVYSETVCFSRNLYCKSKQVIDAAAELHIYGDRFVVTEQSGERVWLFAELGGATVLGRNKLNVYVGDQTYQFSGGKHFNALKYLNLYYHAVGANNGFLGL